MYEELKNKVCQANIELQKHSLVVYSWGNVSEIDRGNNVIAIKPSGVAYEKLTPDKIVLLDIEGNIIEGDFNPSSDTPTPLIQNNPLTFPVCTSTSIRLNAGFDPVPGSNFISPATGTKNPAPLKIRKSRIGNCHPRGRPLSSGL